MKVLYINSLYHPHALGGAEATLKLIVDGVRARGNEVAVLATGAGLALETDEIDGVRVYRAPVENFYWPYAIQSPPAWKSKLWHLRDSVNRSMEQHVRSVLDAERPDLASCHNLAGFSVSVWDVLAERGIPIVQVLHDHYLRCPRGVMYAQDHRCLTPCHGCKALRWSHGRRSGSISAVVGISRFMLDSFASTNYFKNARKRVIYNARYISDAGRARPTLSERRLVFGFIATVAKPKGVEWLIDSFKRLDLDLELLIAGHGREPYEGDLRRTHSSDRIRFVGHVSPSDFFRQIDVCVVPSLWEEPLGMVAVEAAAHHVPVIATNRGGLPESIKHGINGLICDPEHENSLADAMRLLAQDYALRASLVQNARQAVAEFIDPERMANQYQALYKELLQVRA